MLRFEVEVEAYREAGELEFTAGEDRSSNTPAPVRERRREAPGRPAQNGFCSMSGNCHG
jgi:hypothetical protein